MIDRRLITLLAITACLLPGSLPAQDSVRIVIGERYRAGGLQRAFLGSRYRDAWASEVTLPVLDLGAFAGGLTPERMGGGKQTVSLVLRGNDGRRYSFRLIDKDPTPALPVELRGSAAHEILQDQISSQHPMGLLIVHALERAAGVIHSESQPFVMPDDERLGEFRPRFAGQAGLIAERPGDEVDEDALFGEFDNIDGSNRIFRRVAESHTQRVDSRAFLNARLLDLMLGDWDRHRGQWSWGRRPGERLWQPIAEDRDLAFSGLDGLLPSTAHLYVRQLVGFGDEYPAIYGLHHQARELDRQFLAELSRPAWDSVALALQAKMTDRVIEDAVRRLPDAMYEIDGSFLVQALKSRRDELPHAAAELYDFLAIDVEVFLTDLADEVRITSLAGGSVEVTAQSVGGGDPYFARVFDPAETEEIRVFMGGDDDVAIIGGAGRLGAMVRVVGGGGADEVRYEQDVGSVLYYDRGGQSQVTGSAPSTKIRTKPYEPPPREEDDYNTPPHSGSWNVPRGVAFFSADYGLIVRAGSSRFSYGFRKDPYAVRTRYGGAISTQGRFEAEFGLDYFRENSSQHFSVDILASQLGILDFYGFGNDSPEFITSDSSRVRVTTVSLEPRYGFRLGNHTDLGFGLRGQFTSSDADENPFIDPQPPTTALYGTSDFQQAGAFAEIRVDSRNLPGAATKGATLNVRGTYSPAVLDVEEGYGSVRAEGTTYLSALSAPFDPTLALRAGGAKIWGDFPYFDAAFVGGTSTLRGFDTQRFAGDAALYGSAELRLALFQLGFLTMGDFGVLGFADVGRVYVDGDSPGSWHDAFGGGVWISFAGRGNSIVVSMANSDEGDRLHITFGLPF